MPITLMAAGRAHGAKMAQQHQQQPQHQQPQRDAKHGQNGQSSRPRLSAGVRSDGHSSHGAHAGARRASSSLRIRELAPPQGTSYISERSRRLGLVIREGEQEKLWVEGERFTGFITAVVLLNLVAMGMQVDLGGDDWNSAWLVCENAFTIVFLIEMFLKMASMGLLYKVEVKVGGMSDEQILEDILRGKDSCTISTQSLQHQLQWVGYFADSWNIIDFFIVIIAIVDCWIIPRLDIGDTSSLSLFRMLRLVRILKLLRAKRELLVLMEGIFASLGSMVWIIILLGLAIYTFSIVMCLTVGREEYSEWDNDAYFGSLLKAMLTLFNMSILDEWSAIVRPISGEQPFMVFVLGFFIVMVSFGLMNAIVGIIVDKTSAAQQKLQNLDAKEELQRKIDEVYRLKQLMLDMDEFRDGRICAEEMKKAEGNQVLISLMSRLNLPQGFKPLDLHEMLDVDGSGDLSRAEFLTGVFNLLHFQEFHFQCHSQLSYSQIKRMIATVAKQVDRINRNLELMERRQVAVEQRLGIERASTTVPAGCVAEAGAGGNAGSAEKHRPSLLRASLHSTSGAAPPREPASQGGGGGGVSGSALAGSPGRAPGHTQAPAPQKLPAFWPQGAPAASLIGKARNGEGLAPPLGSHDDSAGGPLLDAGDAGAGAKVSSGRPAEAKARRKKTKRPQAKATEGADVGSAASAAEQSWSKSAKQNFDVAELDECERRQGVDVEALSDLEEASD